MDIPKAPQDIELRNIIDKLAQFVARNGPEFEQMTKNKQKGNPKFGFLFGGEYYNYYQYKVSSESATKWRQGGNWNVPPPMDIRADVPPTAPPPIPFNVPPTNQPPPPLSQWMPNSGPPLTIPPPAPKPPPSLDSIAAQQSALHDQIAQSEQNLNAQHLVLMQQEEMQIEAEIQKEELEGIVRDAEDLGINLNEFDSILQPIIDSCTKDSISNGKAYILQRATSSAVNDLIARYLLYKVLEPDRKFNHKLHIIYLVNDILHHCVRKHIEDFKLALEKVVVPMFCNASLGVNEEQQVKLSKLLVIWETKNHYFSEDIVACLKDPTNSWNRWKQDRLVEFGPVVDSVSSGTKSAVSTFQSQHLAFVSHATRQIQQLEQQRHVLIEGQKQAEEKYREPPPPVQPHRAPPPPEDLLLPPINAPPPSLDLPININQPPPGFCFPAHPIELPDLTRPPPGFPPVVVPEIQPEDLLPSLPYYDLPAGLMVPLIKLEDFSYKSLDPDSIRLPPPAPPSERLLTAVKAFYLPPRHEQPRDSDGWEKLGLYEYFRAKAAAKKQREMEIEAGTRRKSRSPTPVRSYHESGRSPPPKRRYSSRSRSRSRDRKSRRGSRRGDRERSPTVPEETKSRRKPEPLEKGGDDSNGSSREARSPTPPSFLGIGSFSGATPEERLTEANKGHQMLKKMGWGGAGLGAKEQGIEQPISGGDVRDRSDQYKGVGINLNDPYENFRKSKGQAFITRMKARAEERAS